MTPLIVFLIAGMIVGTLRGGGLSGLAGIGFRAVWLIFVALAAELSLRFLPMLAPQLFPDALPFIQVARFLPLFLFGMVNMSKWQIWLVVVGVTSNFLVIYANKWLMPVSWTAIASDPMPAGYFILDGQGASPWWFLGDVIPVWLNNKVFASAGDMLLGLGVLLLVQHAMARYSSGRHVRGSLARESLELSRESRRSRVGENLGKPKQQEDIKPDALAPRAARQEPTLTKADLPELARPTPPPPEADRQPETQHRPEPLQPRPAGQAPAPLAAVTPDSDSGERTVPPPANIGPPKLEPHRDIEFLPFAGPFPSPETDEGVPVRLSPRLATIANMIDRRAVVADIGCDHGKLSAYLALTGSPRVIASDVSAKSLSKARQLVKEMGLQKIVQTRVADGLKKIRPGEADVVVIAGLGGPTISAVLQSSIAAACAAGKLILQPMNAVGVARKWLADNGFCIVDEQLAEEDGRIYQIIAAVPGTDAYPPMSLFDLEIGHLLIDRRHPLLSKLLKSKIATIGNILSEIADNATVKAEARRNELIELRGRCEEALEWIAG